MSLAPDTNALCSVLRAACRVDDAVGGMIHLCAEGSCKMAAHWALPESFYEAFHFAKPGDGTTISDVTKERRRVVIRDVTMDDAFTPHRAVVVEAGVVAVQSTPIFSGTGYLYGVLSTFYARPHHPEAASFELLDGCANLVAKILLAHELEVAIEEPLPTAAGSVVRASVAVEALIESLEHATTSELLTATNDNLDRVIEELKQRVQRVGAVPAHSDEITEVVCNL